MFHEIAKSILGVLANIVRARGVSSRRRDRLRPTHSAKEQSGLFDETASTRSSCSTTATQNASCGSTLATTTPVPIVGSGCRRRWGLAGFLPCGRRQRATSAVDRCSEGFITSTAWSPEREGRNARRIADDAATPHLEDRSIASLPPDRSVAGRCATMSSTRQQTETDVRFPFAAVPSSPLTTRAGQDPSRLLVRTEFLRRTGGLSAQRWRKSLLRVCSDAKRRPSPSWTDAWRSLSFIEPPAPGR